MQAVDCPCVGKHIPKAMELQAHYIFPIADGGSDANNNVIYICPTTNANIRRLWRIYDQVGGRPSWDILKNYSEFARGVVEKGRELRRAHNQVMQNGSGQASTPSTTEVMAPTQ